MSSAEAARWLVTINGRVVIDTELLVLRQGDLAVYLTCHGESGTHLGGWYRSEFAREVNARTFHTDASREFPEDDVRLWASVDPSTPKER